MVKWSKIIILEVKRGDGAPTEILKFRILNGFNLYSQLKEKQKQCNCVVICGWNWFAWLPLALAVVVYGLGLASSDWLS